MIPITNLSYADESFDNISNKMIDNINIMGDLQELDNLNYYSELLSKYDLTKESIENLVEERKNFTVDTQMSKLYSDDQVKLMKLEFQIENGTEDIFKVVQKSDNIKTEVNGFKGIIKTTILDENGMEVNTFIENYFETLENMNESSKIIESEMTRATKIIPSNQFGSGTIASYFSLDTSNHHRALADCYLTYGIYKKLNEL